jgi:hypothetical protein
VTPAAPVTFFRPEFDDFLFAPIGPERNEMLLSVLSALSRLNVDPWEEAAELSNLPKDTASKRLASLIARLPGGRWTQADSGAIADRLIELLPSRGSYNVVPSGRGLGGMSAAAKILICAALGFAALIFAASREPSSRSNPPDAPASMASPPQTSPPSYR